MKTLILSLTTFLSLVFSNTVWAQIDENTDTTQSTITKIYQELEVNRRFKINGYIQAQFQLADSAGESSFDGGNFPSGTDKRFAIRRGRIRMQYESPANEKKIITSLFVMQFDVTEKGLTIKDAFVKLTDPWIGWASVTAGMQNRPFGFEVPFSSNLRESPERGRMSQIIFPGERDLGAMITIQPPKSSRFNWLKLDAGMFNGNGARGPGLDGSDFDKYKDFIGRFSINKSSFSELIKFGFGVSYYYGGYRVDTVNVNSMGIDSAGMNAFTIENKKSDFYNVAVLDRGEILRKYVGIDAQFSIEWKPGITTLRAEYIQGDQPGFTSSSAPWSATTSPAALNASDIYKRKFNGGYFYLLQNILQSPVQIIVKYDWYDPNTKIEGDAIGKKVTGNNFKAFSATDLKYETWGFGLAYRWDSDFKITAYYDLVKNETSENLVNYQKDLHDNVFTLRFQMKF